MGDHMVGRAAAVIAKQLLLGKRVTCVRVDKANIAGSEIRNKIKYLNFLRKRKLTNPTLGPFHKRAPNEVFTRIVRGMLPFYTKRGKLALRRLQVYEGVPSSVARKGKRYTIPKAERHTRLMPERASRSSATCASTSAGSTRASLTSWRRPARRRPCATSRSVPPSAPRGTAPARRP